jgi:hypothetical protein
VALNTLIRPDNAPKWLRPKLMEILTGIPLRPDGVRATLEVIFSMHPSSTVKMSEAAAPQKRGANITHEALTVASNVISVPPSSVSPEAWYSTIAPQLLKLLDGDEGPELVKVASYIIGFGILGRRASGAPGMPPPPVCSRSLSYTDMATRYRGLEISSRADAEMHSAISRGSWPSRRY